MRGAGFAGHGLFIGRGRLSGRRCLKSVNLDREAAFNQTAAGLVVDRELGYLLQGGASWWASTLALLPGLDVTTMGWFDRDWYLGEHAKQVFDRTGNAGPTACFRACRVMAQRAAPVEGRVFAVVGAKGGVGATTIAVKMVIRTGEPRPETLASPRGIR